MFGNKALFRYSFLNFVMVALHSIEIVVGVETLEPPHVLRLYIGGKQ